MTSSLRDQTNSIHPLRALLPGLALVGFTIGTGSVTSMVKAGADYGLELLWALVLSCIVTYFLFEAFGRLTLVTGKTMLRAVWEDIHPALAVFICLALTVNVSGSIMGVMGIVADVLSEWSASMSSNRVSPTVFAGALSLFIFVVLVLGNTKSFQGILALLAGVMGVCFLLNSLRMLPTTNALASGLIPHFPNATGAAADANGLLVTASMVGTTVAPIVLVFRSIMLREEGWTAEQLATQRRDARVSATLIFVVSGAVMASAAATLHVTGIQLNHAREMIPVLQPIAGRWAVIIFVVGITAAGISSQFPNVVSPVFFVSDLRGQPVQTRTTWAIACLFFAATLGLVVPVFKARPVLIMLASQALGAILLPVTVACILYLLNCSMLGEYKNNTKNNVVLSLILVFAVAMGGIGIAGLLG